MASLKIVVLSLFCIEIKAHLQYTSIPFKLASGLTIQDTSFLTNPGQVYGVCDSDDFRTKEDKVFCNFVLETKKNSESPDHLRVCNFTLSGIGDRKVVAIDEDKAILITTSSLFSIYILHFNECRAVTAKVDHLKIDFIEVIYSSKITFDVIISTKDDTCQLYKPCLLTLDFEGNLVQGLSRKIETSAFDIVAMVRSSSEGRLGVEVLNDWNVVRVFRLNNEGSIDVLKVHHTIGVENKYYNKVTTSTTHQLLSLCTSVYLNITCSQFNFNGELLFNVNFTFNEFNWLHSPKVHNLPGGGFLLLTFECKKDDCHDIKKNFVVKKIDSVGQLIGTTTVKQFDCGYALLDEIHFFKNENGHMCLSSVCGKTSLDILCFNDEDLIL